MTHLWFKARAFGWGWTPVSVEGRLVVLVFVSALLVSTLYFLHRIRTGSDIRSATSFFRTFTSSTWALGGPRRHQAMKASICSFGPSAMASTSPDGRLRTHPAKFVTLDASRTRRLEARGALWLTAGVAAGSPDLKRRERPTHKDAPLMPWPWPTGSGICGRARQPAGWQAHSGRLNGTAARKQALVVNLTFTWHFVHMPRQAEVRQPTPAAERAGQGLGLCPWLVFHALQNLRLCYLRAGA